MVDQAGFRAIRICEKNGLIATIRVQLEGLHGEFHFDVDGEVFLLCNRGARLLLNWFALHAYIAKYIELIHRR